MWLLHGAAVACGCCMHMHLAVSDQCQAVQAVCVCDSRLHLLCPYMRHVLGFHSMYIACCAYLLSAADPTAYRL